MFVPHCIAVPQGRRVTLRFASPDVIHGLLITGTNVNTMVVPGFVAQVHTEFTRTGDLLMPCHEYCGLGHSEMWATVQVLRKIEFKPDPTGGFPVRNVERLCLAHFWVAFAALRRRVPCSAPGRCGCAARWARMSARPGSTSCR